MSIGSLSSNSSILFGFAPGAAGPGAPAGAVLSAASGKPANIGIAIALLQLEVVDDLVAAIRTADISGGKQFGAAGIARNPVCQPREVFKSNPRVEPREVIHTAAKIVPGPVIYERPRIALTTGNASKANEDHRPAQTGPLPPWKILPWQQPSPTVCKVKIIMVRPDTEVKGSLLDCFL